MMATIFSRINGIALLIGACAGSAAAATLDGPIPNSASPKGFPFNTAQITSDGSDRDLAAQGYVDEEYFVSGQTTRGRIGPYTTRMLVRRPADPRRFNGIVLVEWENVSAGFNIAIDWFLWRRQIIRDGYAMVLAAPQPIGVCALKQGSSLAPNLPPLGGDAIRYAKVTHPRLSDTLTDAQGNPMPLNADGTIPATAKCPGGLLSGSIRGDAESDDIFSQIGATVRANDKKLFGKRLSHMVAAGQSQSSARLGSYVNNIQPQDRLFDLVFLHSGPSLITNTDTKVFVFNSEAEAPGYYELRNLQPKKNVAFWDAAGTSHNPDSTYSTDMLGHSFGFTFPVPDCPYGYADPIYNSKSYAGNAALQHIERWLRIGVRPRDIPMEIDVRNPSDPTDNVVARDQYGNAIGGVGTPFTEVPTARLIGEFNRNGAGACFGTLGADPFNAEGTGPALCPTCDADVWQEPNLRDLYPTHGSYVARIARSAVRLASQGLLTLQDAVDILRKASESDVGKPTATP